MNRNQLNTDMTMSYRQLMERDLPPYTPTGVVWLLVGGCVGWLAVVGFMLGSGGV